jgi:hypothetical protein
MEEGRWSKQSYNQNELRRINYIKEKKEKQRQDQLEKQQGPGDFGMIVEEDGNSNVRKRELKSSKKNREDDVENAEDNKKGKNFYKNKK